jgi:spore coat protein U-like protein
MKKYLVVVAAIAIVIAMVSGVWANDSKDLIVTANVKDTCTAITPGTPVTISLDPIVGGAVVNGGVTTPPAINCTMGATHAVTCSSLNGSLLKNGSNTIAYTYTAGTVCGTNITGNGATAVPLNIGVDIANGAYSNSPSGNYTDTITMTVAY